MNYNILSYLVYLPVTTFITVQVGKICFHHGEVYLRKIIKENEQMVKSINSILLTAYYLLNIGYAVWMLSFWPPVSGLETCILILCQRLGLIVFVLGLLHYNNMLMTYIISQKINKNSKFKPSLS